MTQFPAEIMDILKKSGKEWTESEQLIIQKLIKDGKRQELQAARDTVFSKPKTT